MYYYTHLAGYPRARKESVPVHFGTGRRSEEATDEAGAMAALDDAVEPGLEVLAAPRAACAQRGRRRSSSRDGRSGRALRDRRRIGRSCGRGRRDQRIEITQLCKTPIRTGVAPRGGRKSAPRLSSSRRCARRSCGDTGGAGAGSGTVGASACACVCACVGACACGCSCVGWLCACDWSAGAVATAGGTGNNSASSDSCGRSALALRDDRAAKGRERVHNPACPPDPGASERGGRRAPPQDRSNQSLPRRLAPRESHSLLLPTPSPV